MSAEQILATLQAALQGNSTQQQATPTAAQPANQTQGSNDGQQQATPTIDSATPPAASIPTTVYTKAVKDNAHELHWRKAPPKWEGNIDLAYQKLYPHLIGEVYCRHCGAIPCPLNHDKEKQIRLRDLEFVCDLVQSKKDMEAHVQKVEQKMKALEYKHARWQEEKYTLMDEVRTFQKLQKEWEVRRTAMQGEIGKLSKIRDEHYKLQTVHKQDRIRIDKLSTQVESLTTERDDYQTQTSQLKKLISSQVDKVNQLNRDVTEVKTELVESKSKVKILKVQLAEVNDLKTTVQTQLDEKDTVIQSLEVKVREVLEDLMDKTKMFEEKEMTLEMLIDRLRQQVAIFKESVDNVQSDKAELQAEIERQRREIEALKKQLAEGRRFKQFVEIKREVNQLRERNTHLVRQLPAERLPAIKASGRVKSAAVKTSNKQYGRLTRRPTTAAAGLGRGREQEKGEKGDEVAKEGVKEAGDEEGLETGVGLCSSGSSSSNGDELFDLEDVQF